MTHEQIRAAGFAIGPNGEYYKPGIGTPVQVDRPRTARKLERNPGDGAVAPVQVQAGIGRRFSVHVTSYRKRLLDQDNLCCKYLVDLCRYAGILPSDAPGTAEIKVSQQKVGPKEPERTTIEIYQL
jgi:hypothetical protein